MATSESTANLSNSVGNVDILLDQVSPIEHDFDKKLQTMPVPKKSPPKVLLIDLQNLVENVGVNGFLLDESGTSALTKKNNLRSMLQVAGPVTLAWGTGGTAQSFAGNVHKARIREVPGRLGDDGSLSKIYFIQLQFGIGTHKG